MEQTITIDSLYEGCKEGSRQAQEKLYRALASKMLGVCMRYANNTFEAEDMLQMGFMKVFGNIESYRGEGSFEGWIRRIMVNTAIAAYRKNMRGGHAVEIDETHDGMQTFAMDALECEDLLQIIQTLPAGYRIVFNMYALEGYSHKEIAEALHISEGASKSQLSRARAWLKEKIKGGTYESK
ncbi:RNA polymerase sigma factor [Parapedobacter tibetensis]|uniref:RNA polymerase sigma factor n=1 Tax=Parapedobacter tibetensis TaxID=2972951 RepID=UPI00214DCC88|nr:sigma-70 family RNA polymerase sigma factor [Parapedobacter tibetensis]